MRRQVVLYLVACLYVCQRACIATSADDGDATDDIDYMKYLIHYKYIKEAKPGEPVSHRHVDEESNALREFQHMANIPETGVLDEATKKMMKMPRCGNADKSDDTKSDYREKRYAREGSRWKRRDLTYRITDYTRKLSRSDVNVVIQRAFDIWSQVTPLTFTRRESQFADIELKFVSGAHGDGSPFDGRSGTLAHAFFPRYGGDVHFDEAEPWTIRLKSGINLFQVAAHEIGHSLGLKHSDIKSSLMAPFYRGYIPNYKLHSDDISGIQSLYGPRRRDTTTKKPTITTKTTTKTTKTVTEKPREDGSFDICAESRFDAIATIDGQQYGFVGDYYVRLTRSGIASGYPKRITDRWSRLSTPLDAAVQLKGAGYYKYVWTGKKFVLTFVKKPTQALFFKGEKVWSYIGKSLQSGYPKPISEEFKGLPNDIDSAFIWSGNGKLYFTKGSRYYRYTRNNAIDRGYPRSLSSWRGLPSSVDAAFQDENYKVTYFFKDNQYYRFDDLRFTVARPSIRYPRPIDIWWLACKQDSLRDGTEAETELNELETEREAEEADMENRLSPGLNKTASAEDEATQGPANDEGPENGVDRLVHHVITYVIVAIGVAVRSVGSWH